MPPYEGLTSPKKSFGTERSTAPSSFHPPPCWVLDNPPIREGVRPSTVGCMRLSKIPRVPSGKRQAHGQSGTPVPPGRYPLPPLPGLPSPHGHAPRSLQRNGPANRLRPAQNRRPRRPMRTTHACPGSAILVGISRPGDAFPGSKRAVTAVPLTIHPAFQAAVLVPLSENPEKK